MVYLPNKSDEREKYGRLLRPYLRKCAMSAWKILVEKSFFLHVENLFNKCEVERRMSDYALENDSSL